MAADRLNRISGFARAYAVIMAGGSGTRFWPLSRRSRPKQLLDFFGQASLLEQTLLRVQRAIPPGRTYIFTSETIRDQVLRRRCGVPASQIVGEPVQRNTAPTVALAAYEILRRDPEGIMVILPADHVIRKPGEFLRTVRAGCEWARTEGRSVVLGIKPDGPETGYGYLQTGAAAGRAAGRSIFEVRRFTEKPDLPTARKYVRSGRYLWNAGMFIWRASTLVRNLQHFRPAMARQIEKIMAEGGIRNRRALRRLFPQLEKISIDYALMEEISGVYAVPADIGWSDVGSWSVAYSLNRADAEGNVRSQKSLAIASKGNMIVSPGKFVAAIGVDDLIVVETDDALLICARERAQDVGKAVQELERRGMKNLL